MIEGKKLSKLGIEGNFLNLVKLELETRKGCIPSTLHFNNALEKQPVNKVKKKRKSKRKSNSLFAASTII